MIQAYRKHPKWQIVGFPPESLSLHNMLWKKAADNAMSRRAVYDMRTALTLIAFGVKEFTTANIKDFQNLGFEKLWNPLED